MLSIPVPFVVSLVLATLIVAILRRDGADVLRRPGLLFLIAVLVQSVVVGLRWSGHFPMARLVLPVTAALIPILALWAVADLGGRPWAARRVALAALAVMLSLVPLTVLALPLVDLVLVALFAGAGMRILSVALTPGAFDGVRLGVAAQARTASLTLAFLLVGSALLDLVLALDLVGSREEAAQLVAIGNLVTLVVLAGAIVVLVAARPETEAEMPAANAPPPAAVEDEAVILADATAALEAGDLWRDADLTLAQLARKAGWPARAISAAVNRHHGMNVSQFVNARRIDAAQRLLAETDLPVTAVQFEVGFQTKSNFNRAFREVTGSSPSQWRAQAGGVRAR